MIIIFNASIFSIYLNDFVIFNLLKVEEYNVFDDNSIISIKSTFESFKS